MKSTKVDYMSSGASGMAPKLKENNASKGKEKTGTDNDFTKKTDVPVIDTIVEVKSSTGADANKQDGLPTPDTPLESMDNKHAIADAIQQADALMTDDALADFKESNGAAANALEQQAAAQATDVTYPMEDHKEGNGVSYAEAALASIYGEPSEWDLCITFAVKLLMDETPLPEDATEVEEFFRKKDEQC
ncbi:hypothetical protein E2562_020877 [Oryza meyeriana var. granulata]|uniref:Uncharacterized protein n=1 Tax=Oryza meyeriana var. granulata TaxID=110450 RepID=A0A6G1D4Y5_9ORYZ|nr:hypothetical protein E2562_020877 [Oryza meyeriana var. granulata]